MLITPTLIAQPNFDDIVGKTLKNLKSNETNDSVIETNKEATKVNTKESSEEKKGKLETQAINSRKTFKNKIGMEFVFIPAGEFSMGCSERDTECEENEKPTHKVKITKPFYMGKYEVTQGQWEKVMGKNPSYFQDCGTDCPVEQVSWNDTQEFISKLNEMEDRNINTSASFSSKTLIANSKQYRLPTEEEWEYAARGSTSPTTKYYWGNELNFDFTWNGLNSASKTNPVGQKNPNDFGLFDMLGNVWEWCENFYDKSYYSNSQIDNRIGKGSRHVLRGGSWIDNGKGIRVSYRNNYPPTESSLNFGFRILLPE